DFELTVTNALKRGAVAVLYIDPALPTLPVTTFRGNLINPYRRLADTAPLQRPDGPPVIVLSLNAGERILGPLGVSPTAIWNAMGRTATTGLGGPGPGFAFGLKLVQSDDPITKTSYGRDLGTWAHVELPVARVAATPKSLVGVTPGEPSRVLIWAVMPATRGSSRPATDALAAFIRSLAGRTGVGVAVVAFDRSVDTLGNARAIADLLGRTRWDTIVVLDDLEGEQLRFDTIFGDLIPMFDEYASRAGASAAITRGISNPETWSWPGMEAFPKSRATIVRATGAGGDVRGDDRADARRAHRRRLRRGPKARDRERRGARGHRAHGGGPIVLRRVLPADRGDRVRRERERQPVPAGLRLRLRRAHRAAASCGRDPGRRRDRSAHRGARERRARCGVHHDRQRQRPHAGLDHACACPAARAARRARGPRLRAAHLGREPDDR